MTSDVLILGGGAIGLSLAYELAQRQRQVRLIERGELGQESSWAGAGMIPAARDIPGLHALDRLAALGCELHPRWARQLAAETGIDNGYRRCGGLFLARSPAGIEESRTLQQAWQIQGVPFERLTRERLAELEPQLSPLADVAYVADEAQLRNPRHLRALEIACRQRGVELHSGVAAQGFTVADQRIRSVHTTAGELTATQIVICGGAWSRSLAELLGLTPRIKPIRGQIVLLNPRKQLIRCNLNDGPRYLVPRDDGRVLVGSTEEDVGFVKANTEDAIRGLVDFASSLVPALATAPIERTWSGLRPATSDGLPYLGRLGALENGWIAAGHFRAGLSMSCSTAVVIAQALLGEEPQIELAPFRIDR